MTRSGLVRGVREDARRRFASGAAAAPESPPSSPPAVRLRRPSWLDLRLVTGILLVLLSVVVGARIVAAADETTPMWAVRADLAAGTTVTQSHLVAVRMHVSAGEDRYLSTRRSPAGLALTRDVGAGELLPVAAVRGRPEGSLVSIPVSPRHVPPTIRAGQRVDVYATTKVSDGETRTERILSAVPVEEVRLPPPAEMAVVVRVPDAAATALVRALRSAEIDVTVVSSARTRP
jgi:hypothetical protein